MTLTNSELDTWNDLRTLVWGELNKATKRKSPITDQLLEIMSAFAKHLNKQIIEARIDELKMLDTRSFMSTGKDSVMEVWQSDIDKRINQLRRTIMTKHRYTN